MYLKDLIMMLEDIKLGIVYVLEDLLNYSSKITGCIMGLLMVFLLVSLFIQRMNAEKVIKKKFESLFKD